MFKDQLLKGKRILVTGGGSGLGKEIAAEDSTTSGGKSGGYGEDYRWGVRAAFPSTQLRPPD